MNRLRWSAVALIFLAGFAFSEARAQSTATFSGTLLDPSSATIAGVGRARLIDNVLLGVALEDIS